MTAKPGGGRQAVAAEDGAPGEAEHDVEQEVGQGRELVGERHHRQLALEVGDREPQHVALLEVAQLVHEPLGVVAAAPRTRA